VQTATALYDYEAQAEGDLTFHTGDVIDVIKKGATENEWWTGSLRGEEGQFPGELLHHVANEANSRRELCQSKLGGFSDSHMDCNSIYRVCIGGISGSVS
jgi:hypothetical protein